MEAKIKSLLVLVLISVGITAQTTKVELDNNIRIDNLKRDDYVITSTVQGISKSNRVWLLFIPLGGRSKTKREQMAYKQAIQSCGCDGILQPVYDESRFVIPLILINFSHRKTTVTGKGYRIKTDSDKMAQTAQPSVDHQQGVNNQQPITKNGLSIGDKVQFKFKGETTIGHIVRVTPNNAIVQFTKKSGKVSLIRLDFDKISKA